MPKDVEVYYNEIGDFHRDDGPAIIDSIGNKFWYINGILHREDGPAIERLSGDNYWVFNGILVDCSSQEEFEKMLKMKAFW